MTERKQRKLAKTTESYRCLLDELEGRPQTGAIDADIQEKLSGLLSALHDKQSAPLAIAGIAEVLRIVAPKNILGNAEIISYFRAVLNYLPHTELDLGRFIEVRAPALLKDAVMISEFFAAYGKSSPNKHHLEDILTIFAEENNGGRESIHLLLQMRPVPTLLVRRLIRFIDTHALAEDAYVQLAAHCMDLLREEDVRIITGRERLAYVQNAIVHFYDKIAGAYVRDRDKRVRLVVASHCRSKDVFSWLSVDSDEDVRAALLARFHWRDALEWSIDDRLLDRSYRVREILYGIYKEGLVACAGLSIFDGAAVKHGMLNFTRDGDAVAGQPDQSAEKEEAVVLREFIYRLFEGCLTAYKDEYVKLLKESKLSLEFLYNSRNRKGAAVFLRAIEWKSYGDIPRDFRGFILEYAFGGTLAHSEILDCLKDGVYEVLKHIRDPSPYFSILYDKARTLTHSSVVEEIVWLLRPYLSKMPFVQLPSEAVPVGVNNTTSDLLPNYYFINAHTQSDAAFIDAQFSDYSYPKLYFLVHQARADPRLHEALKSTPLSSDELVSLLLYLGDPAQLHAHADRLLLYEPSMQAQEKMLRFRSLTASLVYFLATGRVSIRSVSFFIQALALAMHCKDRKRLKAVFSKYMNAVDQATYDTFHSVCWELKDYRKSNTTADQCDMLHHSIAPDATLGSDKENTANEPAQQPCKKLVLPKSDQTLHFLCDLVAGARNGTIVEVPADYTKFGFTKMSETEVEMVRYGEVLYV
ncbi:hypothetical protein PAPHI01_1375 [Pancytospora philotis]|nr:hypothetical protein PAPHI01_1375 [Pancytospora philotis]